MTEEEVKEFIIKDSITVQGITEDFVWYNSEKLLMQMNSWAFDFKRIVNVMEARHNEHLKIIGDLLQEIKALKGKKDE